MATRYHSVNGIQVPCASVPIVGLEGHSYYIPNLAQKNGEEFVAKREWTGSAEDFLFHQKGLCYPLGEIGRACAELYARAYLAVDKVVSLPEESISPYTTFHKLLSNL